MEPQKQSKQPQVYSREEYATKDFWQSRYKQNRGYFDWYAEFPELKQTFEDFYNFKKDDSILNIGCGNSKLSDQMYQAGYHNQLNMDISPYVIQQMKKSSQQKGYDKMKWQVMDATDMKEVQSQSFDIALDKGTLDALIAGKNLDICAKMLKQTMRVIKRNGQFVLITHGSPQGRKKLFQMALGFYDYDYYVTRVDLSNMGTLINLMRSNLGDKPLNSIMKDKQAMQKSMLQFNLIQMLRKKRKMQKKYVVWGDYQKKNVVFNQEQQNQKPTNNAQVPQPADKIQQKKVNYNPRKQCYCYVYSIQYKFAADLDSQVPRNQSMSFQQFCRSNSLQIYDNRIIFKGAEDLKDIGIITNDKQKSSCEIVRSLLYLKKKGIANNPVTLYLNPNQYQSSKHKAKFHLKTGNQNYAPIYAKSVIEIRFDSNKLKDNNLECIEKNLKQIAEELTQEHNLHPTPFQYAFLGILFQKKAPGTHYHKLLKRFWYPSYRFYSSQQNHIIYQISLPPSASIENCISLIQKYLKYGHDTIKILRKGYLAYIEPKIFNILTLCSSLYGQQKQFPILVQQFIEEEIEDFGNNGTIVIKEQIMCKSLARLFSAYQ